MKYFVNKPKRKRKSRKYRTAAQKRATKKMLAANKARRAAKRPKRRRAATRRSAPVAKRKGRKRGARRASTSRRRSSKGTKRRSPVTRLRRNKVYVTNRPKRRRGYRRNPNIVAQTKQLFMDTGAVLAGSAAGGVITGFLPDLGNPFANTAKGVLVAIGVRMAAARFLGNEVARFAAAGAMQVPFKNLVIGFLPADQQIKARALLGDYGDMGTYAGVITADGSMVDESLGSYTGSEVYQ